AVLRSLAVKVHNIHGGDLVQSRYEGTIYATEWVGPYNDLAFGLHRAAKYCYYPGWHEPGTILEAVVNADAFNALSADLQAVVRNACAATSQRMVAEFTARNGRALKTLMDEHGADIRPLPADVLAAIREKADEVVAEVGNASAEAKAVYDSYIAYRDDVVSWARLSDQAYLNAR
ncbi:ABC transporter substrate-binding protein, partial [bacterium]|nr:ABC transporter substrate-binding protein [bacterium]